MKLLFFISSLGGGGAERVMSVVTNELDRRGYSVTLAIMDGKAPFYELNKSINVKYFPFRKGRNIYEKLKNRYKLISYIRQLSKDERPDVIISFIYKMNTKVLLGTRFLGIPIIASEHNTLDTKMSKYEWFQRFQVSRLADKLTILTQHDFEYLKGRLKNKIIMPNPLSFNPIEEYNEEREKVILAVGSIKRYYHKGFDNLVEIWARIADKYPDWKLQIAGGFDTQSLNYLKQIEEDRGINNKINFLGQVKDMAELLRRSSIFILSSRWEGFPMVLVEAMSQGCTSISYDLVSGPNEMMTHNFDGILVKNQQKEEMMNELVELIENSEKRKCLAENAIKSVNRFSVKKIVDRWEKLFQEVLKNS
ncbi:glycosyltransferase family 4 protein [Sphingobacterium sp.]|uniref:glycosyltransferase family 4 protein n=1 Tax=Sphingobacterium sp. TaxID=341027 RepID=UPI0031E2B6B2